MPAPTRVSYTETVWNTTAATKATASVAWQAGDLIVVIGATADQPTTISGVTATGLTLTAGTPLTTANSCWANTWTATAAGTSSAVFTATRAGGTSNNYGIGVFVFRAHGGAGARATNTSTAKTVSLTRTGANSRVIAALFDWSAAAVTGAVWTPAGQTVDEAAIGGAGQWTVYLADWPDQGAAGATSYGITGTASTGAHTKLAFEVAGTGGASITGDASLAVTASLSAAGVRGAPGATTLAATAALTAAGTPGQVGATTLAVTAALTATGASTGDPGPGVVPWVRDARYGGTGGTNTALNHSVQIPTCVIGDDLWASFTLNGGHGAVTEPSGWTRIYPTTITDDGFMTLLIYRKAATSTETAGGTIPIVVATAVRGNSGSTAIVGADTAAAPDGAVNSTSTAGVTGVSHTVVASTDNSLILSILALDSATEDPTPTPPLVPWWNPMSAGIIGQGNAGAAVHAPTAGSASYGWTWPNSVARKAWTAAIRSVAAPTGADATLPVTATITAAGTAGRIGATTLTTTAGITAAGARTAVAATTLTTTATITAAAATTGPATVTGDAVTTVTATITTAGVRGTTTAPTVTATAAIAASGIRGTAGGTALPAAAVIAAAGRLGGTTAASLAGTATLTAAGLTGAVAAVTGTATITATGTTGRTATATTLAAVAALSTVGRYGARPGASLSAIATATAATRYGARTPSTLAATATLIAAATIVAPYEAARYTIDGQGATWLTPGGTATTSFIEGAGTSGGLDGASIASGALG